MKEPGVRPPGSLDPGAEEFRPTWILHSQYSLLQPHIYNPYLSYVTSGFNYRAPAAPTADVIPGPASRALQLSMMPRHVTEVTLRMELEAFGEVRTVELGRLAREGIVTVHFYDLRHAVAALVEIQEQCMRRHYMLGPSGRGLIAGHAVWAQFVDSTAEIAGKDGHNQGTVVIFNLDSSVSSSKLIEIFRAFGPVKEVSETPLKRQNVEFYDLRDAARALSEMNGKVLCGKHLVVQFSRSGRQGRRFCKPTAPSSSDAGYPPVPQFPLPPRPAGEQQHHSIVSPTTKASFNGRNGIENQKGENGSKRNFKKPSSRRFPCARYKKSFKTQSEYANFLFKEDEVEESNDRDSRTTVMIKNIPNKYSQELLLNMLDNHCTHCNEKIAEGGDEPLSSYDFVYLPIDFINKCNVGYGFVNLTSPEAAWRLYKSFHRQPWEVFNSRKICQVTYARLQGLDVLKEHFKKSKLACERDEYLPLVFSPPRDGKQLTQPLVIQGQPRTNFEKVVPTAAATTTTISSSRSTSNEESEDALELTDGGDSSVSNQIDGDEDENGDGGARGGDDDRSVVPPVVFGSSDFHTPSPIGAC